MPDQTRNDWVPLLPSELGTLVLVSEKDDVPRLLQIVQYASEAFSLDEGLTKFYFSKVLYAFVAEGSERLAAYSLVRPEDFESAVVGPRCGEVERTLDISVFPAPGLDIARHKSGCLIRHLLPRVTLLKLGKHGQCPSRVPVPGTLSSARINRRQRLISRSHVRIGAYEFESGARGDLISAV